MSFEKKMKPKHQAGSDAVESQVAEGMGAYTPRKLTFAENAILTIKVLAGFGLLGAALWGINLWTSAE